jgi:hypothetical protein
MDVGFRFWIDVGWMLDNPKLDNLMLDSFANVGWIEVNRQIVMRVSDIVLALDRR